MQNSLMAHMMLLQRMRAAAAAMPCNFGSLQAQKEKHILKLKMYENPKLVAELAARGGTNAAAARPAAAAAPASDVGPGARGQNGATAKAADADSDSGIFDDVGDDYQVDVSSLKNKPKDKAVTVCTPACTPACAAVMLRPVLISQEWRHVSPRH